MCVVLKPSPLLTCAYAFASTVKNEFYGNKCSCLCLTFAFPGTGRQSSKKNAKFETQILRVNGPENNRTFTQHVSFGEANKMFTPN